MGRAAVVGAIIASAEPAPPHAPCELAHLSVRENMVDGFEAPFAIPIVRAFGSGVDETKSGRFGRARKRGDLLGGALPLRAFTAADRIKIAKNEQIPLLAPGADLADDLGQRIVNRLAPRTTTLVGISLRMKGDDVQIEAALTSDGRGEAGTQMTTAAIRIHRPDLSHLRHIQRLAVVEKPDVLSVGPVRLAIVEIERPIPAGKPIQRTDQLRILRPDARLVGANGGEEFLNGEEIDLEESNGAREPLHIGRSVRPSGAAIWKEADIPARKTEMIRAL